MFVVEHTTMVPCYLRSNGQAKCFADTFKKVLGKLNKEVLDEIALEQFLRVYHMVPNMKTPAGSSPVELVLVRKVKPCYQARKD